MPDSRSFPTRLTIEVLASVGSGPPWVAVARWGRRVCEVGDGETPELAVSEAMNAVRTRLVRNADVQ